MPIVLSPPEQRVVLRNVSWETYEGLLTENLERSSPRFTYDQGALEIMSPSAEHEWCPRIGPTLSSKSVNRLHAFH